MKYMRTQLKIFLIAVCLFIPNRVILGQQNNGPKVNITKDQPKKEKNQRVEGPRKIKKKIERGFQSLVPTTLSTVPDYFCTWSVQGFVCSMVNTTLQSDAMNEANLFGIGPNQNWAEFFPDARKELYFVLDDTWDIPLGKDRRYPERGCLELNTERFPSCQGTPAERLTKLNNNMRSHGWRGLGLWIFSGRPKINQDPKVNDEKFWAERLGWSRDAGINYWKVDWGSMSTLEVWRLNQWANRVLWTVPEHESGRPTNLTFTVLMTLTHSPRFLRLCVALDRCCAIPGTVTTPVA
jgi:hypothetical protein